MLSQGPLHSIYSKQVLKSTSHWPPKKFILSKAVMMSTTCEEGDLRLRLNRKALRSTARQAPAQDIHPYLLLKTALNRKVLKSTARQAAAQEIHRYLLPRTALNRKVLESTARQAPAKDMHLYPLIRNALQDMKKMMLTTAELKTKLSKTLRRNR